VGEGVLLLELLAELAEPPPFEEFGDNAGEGTPPPPRELVVAAKVVIFLENIFDFSFSSV
jgi:hypothetical protein